MRVASVVPALLILTIVLGGMPVSAQVTSLTFNNQTSGVTIQQGDTVTWRITLPAGADSHNEIWLDADSNGVIGGSDKLLFSFVQTDGQMGEDGPGDSDGLANGVIVTPLKAGLAPALWLFRAEHNHAGVTGGFTVTPLPSPSYSISGTVSGPGDKRNIILEAFPEVEVDLLFWQGLTDASGNYTIALGGDPTTNNPWIVGPSGDQQSFGRYVLLPLDTSVTIAGHHSGVNFNLVLGTVITGQVTDRITGAPVEFANPHFHDAFDPFPQSGSGNNQFRDETDQDGRYSFVAVAGKYFMHFTGNHHDDEWWDHRNDGGMDTLTVANEDTIFNIDGTLLDTLSTGVERIGDAVPSGFSLIQNYPNPFNPATTLRYDIASARSVRLEIFDMLGRSVAVLADEVHSPGRYTVQWDGSGNPSGIYFARLQAGGFVQMRKLVLLK